MSSETITPSVATAVPLTTIAAGSISNDVLTWDGSKWASLQIPSQITYENLTGTTTANTALTPSVDNNLTRGSTSLPWSARILCNNFYTAGSNFFQTAMLSDGYVTCLDNRVSVTAYNADGTSGGTSTLNTTQEANIVVYSKAGVVRWLARCKISGGSMRKVVATCDSSDNIYAAFSSSDTGTATVYNADGTAFGTTFTGATSAITVLAKYNSSGVIQWATYVTATNTLAEVDCIQHWNGNLYMAGIYRDALTAYNVGGASGGTLAYGSSGNATFIIKYNTSGTVQWVGRLAGGGAQSVSGIDVNEYGVFIAAVCGSSTITFYNAGDVSSGSTAAPTGNYDGFIIKYSDSGIFQYYNRIDSPGTSSFNFNNAILVKLTKSFVYASYRSDVTLYPCHANGSRFKRMPPAGFGIGIIVKYSYSGECLDAYQVNFGGDLLVKSLSANDYGVLVGHDWITSSTYAHSDGTSYGPTITIPSGIATAGMAFYSNEGRILWMNCFRYPSNGGRTNLSDSILDGTDVYTNITFDTNAVIIAMPVDSTAITPPVKANTSDVFVMKFSLACLFTLASPSINKTKLITNDTLIDGTIMKITPGTTFTYKSKTYTSILLPRKGANVSLLWNSSSWTVVGDFGAIYS